MGETAGVTWAWWFRPGHSARPDSCSGQPGRLAPAGGSGPALRPPTPTSPRRVHGAMRSASQILWGVIWSAQPCVAGIQSPPFTEEAEGVKSLTHGHKMCVNHSATGRGRRGGSGRAHLWVLDGTAAPPLAGGVIAGHWCPFSVKKPKGVDTGTAYRACPVLSDC